MLLLFGHKLFVLKNQTIYDAACGVVLGVIVAVALLHRQLMFH
jgi:hypothetical protein